MSSPSASVVVASDRPAATWARSMGVVFWLTLAGVAALLEQFGPATWRMARIDWRHAALVKRLQEFEANVRQGAAAVPRAIVDLESQDSSKQFRSLQLLCRIGAPARPAFDHVAKLTLPDRPHRMRREALVTLTRLDHSWKRLEPYLVAAMESSQFELAHEAIERCFELGPPSQSLLETVVRREDHPARGSLIAAVAKVSHHAALRRPLLDDVVLADWLRTLERSTNGQQATQASIGLLSAQDATNDDWRRGVEHVDPLVRSTAFANTARLLPEDAAPTLERLRDHLRRGVEVDRMALLGAVESLGPLASPLHADLVSQFSLISPRTERYAVLSALAAMRRPCPSLTDDLSSLIDAFFRENRGSAAAAAAARILRVTSPEKAAAVEKRCLEQWATREFDAMENGLIALRALQPRDSNVAQAIVQSLPNLTSDHLRDLAFSVLGGMGPVAAPAVPVLVQHGRRHSWLDISAVRVLGSIGPEACGVVPELEESLVESDDPFYIASTEAKLLAIGRIGSASPRFFDLLTECERSPAESLRSASRLMRGRLAESLDERVRCLEAAASDVAPAIRGKFLRQVAEWPADPAFAPVLERLLEDKHSVVRTLAAVEFIRNCPDAARVEAVVAQFMQRPENHLRNWRNHDSTNDWSTPGSFELWSSSPAQYVAHARK